MATLAAPVAHGQDQPAPNPSPGPVIVPPPRAQQQLPGVIPERFSLNPTPSPTPAPVPTPSPTPSVAAPVPQRQTPVVRATPAPREAAPVAAAPTPVASPTALATPTPLASATPQPVATAAPVSEPVSATPPWIWAAAGAGGTALLGLGGWLLRRRRPEDEEEVAAPEPVVAAAPPPVQPPPGLTRPAPAPVPAPRGSDPFQLALNPQRIVYAETEVVLEFELLIANASGASAEHIRIAFAAMSAHARQDEVIAAFHGGPPGDPAGPPFDLAPGAGGRMPVRLAIPREGVQVVQLGGRPMFVPIVLIDLRWRGGLSIRRFGADFMLGTAGQGDKLGPLWLDRPPPTGPLAANRYLAKAAVAA